MENRSKRLHIFRDNEGFWRWHLLDESHNIIDQSAFGFLDKHNCEKQARIKGYH
jgi:uncharacterized protein YegP (UPF0339 family)